MRKYYTEYVRHCLRFYTRHPQAKFKTKADEANWKACESAMHKLTPVEQELVTDIYKAGDTIPDNIHQVSKARRLDQEYLWNLINTLEQLVAKRRGLL